jgi:hypothetical protein
MTRTLLITLAVLLALPLAAQDAAPTRFFIERIEVRDARRVSKDVVIAESRLREGQEYSEADLRDASARLSRLPFLLSADFALEKGSERGRYLLVVSINETKPFFYALDLRPIFGDNRVEPDYSDRIGVADNSGTLGFRWFIGRRGALHTAIVTSDYNRNFARDYAAIVVGYTQYDLFNTRAFATLNLKHVLAEGSNTIAPQLVVGVPLSANQTLTLELDETSFGDDTREILDQAFDTNRGQRVVGATWSYNTTNRPFLPTRGTLLSVRPRFSWSDAATYAFVVDQHPDGSPVEWLSVRSDTVHSEAREVSIYAARYWELSERSSVSGGLQGTLTDFRLDSEVLGLTANRTLRGALTAGYSYSLWDAARTKNGDSRIELNLRVGSRSIDYDDFYRSEQQQLSASWVRRSSWGTLRLGAGYAW